MKEVRQSLLKRILCPLIIIVFVFVIIRLFINFDPDNYIFNILLIYLALKATAAEAFLTAYYMRWKIDFDNEHFIFYSLFQNPVLIKYSSIEKISVHDVHYKDCIHNDITFHLKNDKPNIFRISLPTNAENYSDFFHILMMKTE